MELASIFLISSLSLALPPKLLDSVCYIESHHNPYAINPQDGVGDSIGVCQVKKTTCIDMGIYGDLYDPVVNIVCAAKYLSFQINRYGSVKRGVCAYNKGNSEGSGECTYVKKVFREWEKRKRRSKKSIS